MLYVIGLGLGSEEDITVRGLSAVKSCSKVVLERYTSILGVEKEKLEAFYDLKVDYIDREGVENLPEDSFLHAAKEKDVAFLVVGDPLCATTHSDLILRAREMGVNVDVIHNASVMGAVATCGLQLYNFGATISLCLWNEDMSWKPSSWYEKLRYNKLGGMHTLCLLDIKVHEPDFSRMAQGRGIHYLPPRFMTVADAVQQLLEVEKERKEGLCGPNDIAVGLARLGQKTQKIVLGTLKHLSQIDMGPPLHSLIIPGDMHVLEKEFLQAFAVDSLEPVAAATTATTTFENQDYNE